MADKKDIFSSFCHYHSAKAKAAKTTATTVQLLTLYKNHLPPLTFQSRWNKGSKSI
jgi:hypothetical protein